jgi:hypothetical protein
MNLNDYVQNISDDVRQAFQTQLGSDTAGVLGQLGYTLDDDVRQPVCDAVAAEDGSPLCDASAFQISDDARATQLSDTPAGVSDSAGTAGGTYIQCYQSTFGIVFWLGSQAVSDLSSGLSLSTALMGAAAAFSPAPQVKAAAAAASAALGVMAAVIKACDKGNGTDLTVTWLSFIPPVKPIVVPSPHS